MISFSFFLFPSFLSLASSLVHRTQIGITSVSCFRLAALHDQIYLGLRSCIGACFNKPCARECKRSVFAAGMTSGLQQYLLLVAKNPVVIVHNKKTASTGGVKKHFGSASKRFHSCADDQKVILKLLVRAVLRSSRAVCATPPYWSGKHLCQRRPRLRS